MMLNYRFCLPLILLVFPLGLLAEEPDSIYKTITTREVVIRSFKQHREFATEPLSVSLINGTALRNRNVTGVKEFSAMIPNLFIPDYGSKLTSPVYIRGIGSRINAPSVGLYVDGIPYFEKSAFDFEWNEIDRIEVLRGPQGTLYGRNTMGGIISIYSRSPFRYEGTTLSGSLGNYNNRKLSLSHYNRLTETIGMALSANYSHQGGYFTNNQTGERADQQDAGALRARLEWHPQKDINLQLQTSLDYSDQGGYPYALVDTITHTPGQVDYNAFSSYKRLISTTGATVEYRTDRIQLHSQSAFQYLTDQQGIDQDFTPQDLYFARQNQTQRMLSQEINLKSASADRYSWLVGAFAFWQGVDNEVILEYRAQHYETQKRYDNPTHGVALYHQSTFDRLIWTGLSLTVGLRYDYEKASSDYLAYRHETKQSELMDQFDNRLSFSQLTPKVALQYTFPTEHLLYATITRGYKTGGFNTSFEREKDRSFRPEYSWNYELGTKLHAFDKRLRAEFCLFYIDWKNQQVYQTLPSGRGTMLKNAGRSESKGVEISLQGNPLNGLMVQANYGYTHARFRKYQKDDATDYSGNRLPLVPEQTLSLSGDYTVSSIKPFDRMTCSLSYTGTGRLYWNENNKVSQSYWGLLNGKVSATKGAFTLALWAKNITGEEYMSFYFESMGKGFGQKGRPATFGIDLTIHI